MCLRTVLKGPKLSSRPPRPSVRRLAAYASSFTTADDDTHARGHTSLPAAVDAELSVVRDEGSPIVLVTVKAMRDGLEGMLVRSRALPVPLDPDQNGSRARLS